MQQEINHIHKQFADDLAQVRTTADIEALKVKYLGRKGPIQDLMKALKDASTEERPLLGKTINDLKVAIENQVTAIQSHLVTLEEDQRLKSESVDITLPGRRHFAGRKHVITQALDEIIDILTGMGFSVEYGPEIETDYYNFEALNFSADHPARDMQDTYYVNAETLLRTHTSNVQSRVLESSKPPLRVISPGKVYRNETITARSHVFFHQVEGFYIDENVTFADLISTLDEFIKKLFKSDVETRFRPSYFPFVEPGLEGDVACLRCSGAGCNICKHTGWLEVLGAGMIHPEVLRNAGIDPEKYTGFAWGMGVERLYMLKYGIDDVRRFTENDLRFLRQFPAV